MVELHHHPISRNLTILRGRCIEPFLDAFQFSKGGRKMNRVERLGTLLITDCVADVDGRLCAHINALPGNPVCCLPCPATDWVYPESMFLHVVKEIFIV